MSTDQDNNVDIPDTLCPLDDHNLAIFKESVDITEDDGNFGIDLYNNSVAEVTRLLEAQRQRSL